MKAKVLIVDDEPAIRRLVSRTLARRGYECHSVENAQAVRQSLAIATVDLLISDIRMPGESGLDLVRSVSHTYPHMAIMMVSGLDDGEVIESVIDMGVDGYITKPFETNQLLVSAELALSHRRLSIEGEQHRRQLEHRVDDRAAKLAETVKSLVGRPSGKRKSQDPFQRTFYQCQSRHRHRQADPGRQRFCLRGRQPGRRSHHRQIPPGCAAMFDSGRFPPKRGHRTAGLGPAPYPIPVGPRTASSLSPRRAKTLWRQFCIFPLPTGEIVAFISDETERILAERQLRDQVNFIQNLIESFPSPMFYKGTDGCYQGLQLGFRQVAGPVPGGGCGPDG